MLAPSAAVETISGRPLPVPAEPSGGLALPSLAPILPGAQSCQGSHLPLVFLRAPLSPARGTLRSNLK